MATVLTDPPRRHGTATGILLIVLGALAILSPLFAGAVVTTILGWVVLLGGVAHLAYAWSARRTGTMMWQSLIGALYLIVALYLILHPQRGLLTLTLLLATYFVVEGVLEIIIYFRLRAAHSAGWTLWNGLVTLVLGVLIWAQWPFSSVWAVGTLLGISLLLSGVARLTFRSGPPPLTGGPGGTLGDTPGL